MLANIAQQSNDVNYLSYYLVAKLHSIGASTSPISHPVIPSNSLILGLISIDNKVALSLFLSR